MHSTRETVTPNKDEGKLLVRLASIAWYLAGQITAEQLGLLTDSRATYYTEGY